jgi:Ni/Co efflux regulator RcnB
MKAVKTILLLTGILVAGLAFNSMAQVPEKEKSDKISYAFNDDKHKNKDRHKNKDKNKNKHKNKAHKEKTAHHANKDKHKAFKSKAKSEKE